MEKIMDQTTQIIFEQPYLIAAHSMREQLFSDSIQIDCLSPFQQLCKELIMAADDAFSFFEPYMMSPEAFSVFHKHYEEIFSLMKKVLESGEKLEEDLNRQKGNQKNSQKRIFGSKSEKSPKKMSYCIEDKALPSSKEKIEKENLSEKTKADRIFICSQKTKSVLFIPADAGPDAGLPETLSDFLDKTCKRSMLPRVTKNMPKYNTVSFREDSQMHGVCINWEELCDGETIQVIRRITIKPREFKGKASKLGCSHQNHLGENMNGARFVHHSFDENWLSDHPEAHRIAPHIFTVLETIPEHTIPVIHIIDQYKCLEEVEKNDNESENDKKSSSRGRKKAEARVVTVKADDIKPLYKGSPVTPGLIASFVCGKYISYVPFYRQFYNRRLHGQNLSRQWITKWVNKVWKDLMDPLFNQMMEDIQVIEYLHMDETTVYVLEVTQTTDRQKCYYIGVTSGKHEEKQMTLYLFFETKDGSFVTDILDSSRKYHLNSDANASYFLAFIVNSICHDHNRRNFIEAIIAESSNAKPVEAMLKSGMSLNDPPVQEYLSTRPTLKICFTIREMYKQLYINESIYVTEGLTPEQIQLRRIKESKPILDEMYKLIDPYILGAPKDARKNGQYHIPKKSKIGEALTFMRKQKDGLYAYIYDGKLQMTNIRQEQKFKPVTKIRDNSRFFDTIEGAVAGGGWLSIIQTCFMNGINPERYIEYILRNFNPKDEECMKHIQDYLPYSANLPGYLRLDSDEDVPADWRTEEFMKYTDADEYFQDDPVTLNALHEAVKKFQKGVQTEKNPQELTTERLCAAHDSYIGCSRA